MAYRPRAAYRGTTCRLLCVLACLLGSVAGPSSMAAGGTGAELGVATVRASGLILSLRLPGGPYFLGELLRIRVALSNHSPHAVTYYGGPQAGCNAALSVALTGGSAPASGFPWYTVLGCGGVPPPHSLTPGATLTNAVLVPLTVSGRVRLAAGISFWTTTRAGGQIINTTGPGPFARRWPTVITFVARQPPPDRVLTLQHTVSGVRVIVPHGTQPHLVYQDVLACRADAGTWLTGTNHWASLEGRSLPDQGCAAGDETWQVMISAPGFTIVSGAYTHGRWREP